MSLSIYIYEHVQHFIGLLVFLPDREPEPLIKVSGTALIHSREIRSEAAKQYQVALRPAEPSFHPLCFCRFFVV